MLVEDNAKTNLDAVLGHRKRGHKQIQHDHCYNVPGSVEAQEDGLSKLV